ncbi:hypothetical protein [Streptosporangium sp. CA-115845]|uniref:hypothetical protein n=1 Tax=Streptosporangium sp. CA-115845 TaxID=3240071 RepID=UPI003D91A691
MTPERIAETPATPQKGKRREIHYRVALLLTNGARIRPVCRVPGCDWRGHAHVAKPAAEHERTIHQAWHAAKAAPSRPVSPSTQGVTS